MRRDDPAQSTPRSDATTPANFIFLHLGPSRYEELHHPDFGLLALQQCRMFDNTRIYFLAAADNLAAMAMPSDCGVTTVALEDVGVSPKQRAFHDMFRATSQFDAQFRHGFWGYVIERFFVIETLMRQLHLSNVFHSENDNLVYFNGDTLAHTLNQLYTGLAVAFDSEHRGIAGLIYLRTVDALAQFTAFVLRYMESVRVFSRTDMDLLALFRQNTSPTVIDYLPVVPDNYPGGLRSTIGEIPTQPQRFWNHIDALQGIFDCGAIGQYLGGVDPRNAPGKNTVGFINETSIFNPSRFSYGVAKDAQERTVPSLTCEGRNFLIYNLHVHSKNLRPFCSFA